MNRRAHATRRGGASVQLEDVATGEAAALIEMVEDGRVDGCELLQTWHLTKVMHGPLSSSKGQV